MRVVIAPDSFKGSASAAAVASALAQGWLAERPADQVTCLPLADGGEGTLDVLAATVPGARWRRATVTGPGGEPVECGWLELPGAVVAVELARASGLPLLTRPDLRAFEWIRANTAKDSGFLVNSFLAFNDSLNVGSDGGWWLALLTKRNSSTPPINYGTESGPRPDFRQWINALPSAIQAQGIESQSVKSMLSARGVNYVYIGQKQGSVNSPGPLLDASTLLKDPDFHLVYQQDRVWIFAYRP